MRILICSIIPMDREKVKLSFQVSAQVLMVILDHESASMQSIDEKSTPTNYFTYFLSRIHREEDFHFILCGLIKLLNNPLLQV